MSSIASATAVIHSSAPKLPRISNLTNQKMIASVSKTEGKHMTFNDISGESAGFYLCVGMINLRLIIIVK
jgi:hypothetical protein